MGWIYQAPDRPPLHRCEPPTMTEFGIIEVAVGNVGSVWSCDDCGQLWEILEGPFGRDWRPASRTMRRWLKKQGIWTGKQGGASPRWRQ